MFNTYFHNINPNLRIEYASEGIAGLLAIGSNKANIVILDIEIPGMNGIEVCRKLAKDKSLTGIKIVLVSGHMEKYLNEINQLDVALMLEKPFKLDDLEQRLIPLLSKN